MQWKNPFRRAAEPAPAITLTGQAVAVDPPPSTTRARRQARIGRLEQALADCAPTSPKRGPVKRELHRLRLLEEAEG